MSESKPRNAGIDRRALLTSAGALAATGGVLASAPAVADDFGGATGTPSLRRPGRHAPQPGSTEPLPSIAVIVFNRLAFGPRPGDVAAFRDLGSTPFERLTNWVDQQIDWQSIPDPVADARIAASGFTTLNKTRQQLWIDHVANGTDTTLPREEAIRAAFLRAIYSERQLIEVMADF